MLKWLIMLAGMLGSLCLHAQSIGDFISVLPRHQTDEFEIPRSHHYQLIIQAGDHLSAGGIMPVNADFTGYVPINGSSTLGRVSVNSESIPGGVTVLDVVYHAGTELWEVTASEVVDLTALEDSGLVATVRNCSGGVTPWGTVITCEEQEVFADLDSNGYSDQGWAMEIDPASRRAVDHDGDSLPDKLWAMGHFRHENAACAPDSITVYEGEDNFSNGFLFKFVADQKAHLGSGALYALQKIGTHGQWLRVPNATQAERNRTGALADSLGATRFVRIEDVEIGPDGQVYFASTAFGRVYRFRDHGATISHFETFVETGIYRIESLNSVSYVHFNSPDNLAFDDAGNLWVLQDGGGNFVWVIGPHHTAAAPSVRIFANTVAGCEPTGITFTPDHRFLWMSLQHPSAGNALPNIDCNGDTVIFNRSSTIVIARSEFLATPLLVDQVAAARMGLEVYPNPATDIVHLSLDVSTAGIADIVVVELLGRVTQHAQRTLESGHNVLQLNLAALPTGNYALVVTTADGRVVRAITKK